MSTKTTKLPFMTNLPKVALFVAAMLLITPLFQACSDDDNDLKVKHVRVKYLDRGCGGIVLTILDEHRNFGAPYGCGVAGCSGRAVWAQQFAFSRDNLKNGAEYFVDMERIEPIAQPICALYVSPPEVSVKLLKVY
jgi:hypothetical protein